MNEISRKKVSRRSAISAGAKIAIGTVAGLVVGGVSGYFGGLVMAPERETIKAETVTTTKTQLSTITLERTIEKTVTTTLPITGTPTTITTPSYELKKFPGAELRVPHPAGWGSWEPGLKLIPEFEEATEMRVRLDMLSWDDINPKQILEARQQSGVYDVVTISVEQPIMPYLIPLTPYIEELYGSIEAFEKDVLSIDLQKVAKWNGEYIGVPIHGNIIFTLCREDLFTDSKNQKEFESEYGRELKPPKTYDELKEVAEFFNNPPDFWGLATMMHRVIINFNILYTYYDEGYELLDKDFRPVFKYDDKAYETLVSIIRWWQDAYQKWKFVSLETIKWLDGELFDFFSAGKAAIAIHVWDDFWGTVPGYNAPDVRAKIGKLIPVPIPTWNKQGIHRGGLGSWWIHGIPRGAKKPEASWQYIKWAISDRVQLANAGGQFPPYKHQALEALKKTLPHAPDTSLVPSEEIINAFLNTKQMIYNYAADQLVIEVGMEPMTEFQGSLELCFLGQVTPEEVVEKFANDLEAKLEEAGYYKK